MYKIVKKLALSSMCAILMSGSVIFSQIPEGYKSGLTTITKKEIKENLSFLASDSLKGRPAGSEENLIAAMFIAEKFQKYGLKPLLKSRKHIPKKKEAQLNSIDDDTEVILDIVDQSAYEVYFQKFNLVKSRLGENNSLKIFSNPENSTLETKYRYREDFLIQYRSTDDILIKAPVVYLGYGIDKGENGYSDYVDSTNKPIDIKNKIVMIVDGFPQENDSTSEFCKSKNSMYRSARRKADIAKEKGALAVLILNSPFKIDPPLASIFGHSLEKDNYILPDMVRNEIPMFYLTTNVINGIFKDTGTKLKNLIKKTDEDLKSHSFELSGKNIELAVSFSTKVINTQNVAAFLEGTDPVLKNEVLVLGAHYDHIGLGYYGAMDNKLKGQIHNGADDNASGVAGLIETAEAFSKNPPKRSILFLAFSAEENGIHGSRYYVNAQPLKPLEKTIAMINMDMIGRNESTTLSIGGAFYSKDLISTVELANNEVGFKDLFYNMGLLSMASDQAHFLRKEIPSIFLFAGMHDDYHMPSDKIDKINFEKIEKAAKLAYLTGWIVSNSNEKPAYQSVSMEDRAEIVRESMERQKKYKEHKN